jgi:hypothetical protein
MWRYEITVKNKDTGRQYPKIYGSRSQEGPKNYVKNCMNKKVEWIKKRSSKGHKNISIETELIRIR